MVSAAASSVPRPRFGATTALYAGPVLWTVGWLVATALGSASGWLWGVPPLLATVLVAVVRAGRARLLERFDASLRELGEARDQLAHQATHDDLTGLPNRRRFVQAVHDALERYPAEAVHLALVDLDDFKAINDRLGHHVGDEVLIRVAERLSAVTPDGSLVVRLGGDEFALILAPATAGQADEVVRRGIEALTRPVRAHGHELLVGASVGLAAGAGAVEPREVFRRADVAMYAAKDRGKHRFARYDPELDRGAVEDARLGAELRQAMSSDQLHLVYQPIVRIADGGLVGVEALARWTHPERGTVSPEVFIPAAERTGLIVTLGDWILREACRQVATWHRSPDPVVPRVSVNVSARQLREPDFVDRVAAILAETGADTSMIAIELTETAVFDGGVALESVRGLRALGVTVALDDFGTGHSSLGLLRSCPVDVLKLDRGFVDGVTTDTDQSVIATALLHLARGLHLDAVAEGIETAEQAAHLYALGYRYAQGHHFAYPMRADELARWVTA